MRMIKYICQVSLVLLLITTGVVFGNDTDLVVVKEITTRLNRQVAQNEWNDAHGLSNDNNYIIDIRDVDLYNTSKFVKPWGNTPFVTNEKIEAANSTLEALSNKAENSINLYFLLNGTLLDVGQMAEYNSGNISFYEDEVKSLIRKLVKDVYANSNLVNMNEGRNALVSISPLELILIDTKKDYTQDQLKYFYIRAVKFGEAFLGLHGQTIVSTGDIKYSTDPDAAFTKHVDAYIAALEEYGSEEDCDHEAVKIQYSNHLFMQEDNYFYDIVMENPCLMQSLTSFGVPDALVYEDGYYRVKKERLLSRTADAKEAGRAALLESFAQTINGLVSTSKYASDETMYKKDNHLEILEDKFSAYNRYTDDKKIFFLRKEIPFYMNDTEWSTFEAELITKVSGVDMSKSTVVLMPYYEGKKFNSDYEIEDDRIYQTRILGEAKSSITTIPDRGFFLVQCLEMYKQVPKPYRRYIHFVRVDGSAGSFTMKNEASVTGYDKIVDVHYLWDQKNITLLRNWRSEMLAATQKVHLSLEEFTNLLNKRDQIIDQGLTSPSPDGWETTDQYKSRLRESVAEDDVVFDGVSVPKHVLYAREFLREIYRETFIVSGIIIDHTTADGLSSTDLFDPDYGQVVYFAIDASALIASAFGADAVFEAAGFAYAVHRGDLVDASIYAASASLVIVSPVMLKQIKNGVRFMIKNKKVIIKGTAEFKTAVKELLGTTADDIATNPRIYDLLANDGLVNNIKALSQESRDLLLKEAHLADDLLDAMLKKPELIDSWSILFKESDEISAALRKNPVNLQKLNDYIVAEGADLTKLKNTFKNTAYPEKWLELKIPKNKLDETFSSLKNDPPANIDPWTPEHKSQRWNNYKEGDGTLDFESWSNGYDGNINKAVKGNKKVKDYANNNSLDISESGFERTWKDPFTGTNKKIEVDLRGEKVEGFRRHDIYDEDLGKAIEVKDYRTQNVSKSVDIEREALMDIELLKAGDLEEVEWVFLGNGPSGPLRELLIEGGIKISP